MYVRLFDLICLVYISVVTLESHLKAKDTKTILIPFGFIFLGISQFTLFLWIAGSSDKLTFYSGLALRWIGLALFLWTAYRSFYGSKKGELLNEDNS
jgi:hypothetical protein